MRGTAAAVFAKSSLFEQTIPASVEISDIESVAPCLAFFASRVSGSELLTDLSEHMRTAGGSCLVLLPRVYLEQRCQPVGRNRK